MNEGLSTCICDDELAVSVTGGVSCSTREHGDAYNRHCKHTPSHVGKRRGFMWHTTGKPHENKPISHYSTLYTVVSCESPAEYCARLAQYTSGFAVK